MITFCYIAERSRLFGISYYLFFGLAWFFSLMVKELLSSWHGPFKRRERKEMWRMAPIETRKEELEE